MLNTNWLFMGRGDMFIDDSIRHKDLQSPPELSEEKDNIMGLINEYMRMKGREVPSFVGGTQIIQDSVKQERGKRGGKV